MAITILDPQFIDALYLQIWNKYLVSSLMCPGTTLAWGPAGPASATLTDSVDTLALINDQAKLYRLMIQNPPAPAFLGKNKTH